MKEMTSEPKRKASAPKLSQIRQFSHIILAQSLSDSAPTPKPPLKKNRSPQRKRFLTFFIIAIYFGLTLGMMLWLQTINSQLQADLDRSLSETQSQQTINSQLQADLDRSLSETQSQQTINSQLQAELERSQQSLLEAQSLQTRSSQLQADLDRSQQSLLESKASLNSLLCNYQQGKFGDADEKLEQRLEHINQQLHEGSGSVAQTRTNCTPTRSTFRPE